MNAPSVPAVGSRWKWRDRVGVVEVDASGLAFVRYRPISPQRGRAAWRRTASFLRHFEPVTDEAVRP